MSLPVFGLVDRLITERGSASVLREHIAFIKTQYEFLEQKNKALSAENEELSANNEVLRQEINELKQALKKFHEDNPRGLRCNECGSVNLKRIGNREDGDFGDQIMRELFRCADCEAECAYMPAKFS